MEKSFSIRQAIKYGFSAFFNHAILLLLAVLTYLSIVVAAFLVVGLIAWLMAGSSYEAISQMEWDVTQETVITYSQELASSLSMGSVVVLAAMMLALWLFLYGLSLGFLRIFLDIYEFDSSSVSQLFSYFNRIPKMLVADALFGIVTSIGLLLLFVPGLFVIALYGFYRLYLLETNSGIVDSFRYSSRLAEGVKGHLMGFYLVVMMIGAASSLFFPLYIITIPSLILARVFVYKKLQEQMA